MPATKVRLPNGGVLGAPAETGRPPNCTSGRACMDNSAFAR